MAFLKIWKLILLCLLYCVVFFKATDALSQEITREAAPTLEKEKNISGGVSVDFSSKYVWRGIPLSEGPVLQSQGWFYAYGAQVLLWTNLDLGQVPEGRLNEVDLQMSYEYEWKNLSIEPILIFYFFPNQGGTPPTGEAGFKLSYKLGPIKFSTGQAFDMMEFRGSYFGAFGVSYEREFTPYFSLQTAAGIGWANSQFNEAYFGVPKGALNLFQWNLGLTFTPCRYLFLTPHLRVSTILDGALQKAVDTTTNVVGGLELGAEF